MKTIMITGASGFLGAHLLRFLSKCYNVVGIKRQDSNLWRFDERFKNKIKFININDIQYIDFKIDYIIHTATNYGRKNENLSNILESNLLFGIKMLEFARNRKVKAFINTNTLQNPDSSPYCLSKSQFGQYFKYFGDIKIIDVYIEHMYGPLDDCTKFVCFLIKEMIKNKDIVLTKGEQMRDFVYIQDCLDAFYLIIKNINNFDKYVKFELGSGKQIALKDFITLIYDIFCTKSPTRSKLLFGKKSYKENESMNIKADITLLKQIGFTPKNTHADGINKTIIYYLNRGGVTTTFNPYKSSSYSKVA